jgi:hypothetical protein
MPAGEVPEHSCETLRVVDGEARTEALGQCGGLDDVMVPFHLDLLRGKRRDSRYARAPIGRIGREIELGLLPGERIERRPPTW